MIYRGDYARTGHYANVTQSPASNELLWKGGSRFDGCRGPAAPYEGVAYFGCYGDFHARDLYTGQELWRIEDLDVRSPPVVVDNLLYFGSVNRNGDDWDIRISVVDPAKRALVRDFDTEAEPESSMIVIDGTIYFTQWSNLHAIDAVSGAEKWKFEKQGVNFGGLDDISPAVGFGMIYFTNRGEGMTGDVVTPDGHLYAVDMQTGKEAWSYATIGASTPVVNEPDGLVYVGTNDALVALDGRTGAEKWKRSGIYGPPALYEGKLYAPAGTRDSGYLAVLDARTGNDVSRIDAPGGLSTPSTIAAGVLYFGSSRSTLTAFDLATGETLWDFKTVDNLRFTPVLADGVVLMGDFDSLYAIGSNPRGSAPTPTVQAYPAGQSKAPSMFRANPQHTGVYDAPGVRELAGARWQTDLGGEVQSSPAIAGGTLYIGSSNGYMNALDADSGAWRWRYRTGGSVVSSPAIANNILYFGSQDGYFYALDSNTGARLWRFKTAAGIVSSPAVANDIVYFGGLDKQMYALDAATGQERWRFGTEASLTTSPAVHDGVVYFGSAEGDFYTLDAATGQPTIEDGFWTVEQITSPAAVEHGKVYFGSQDGYLYVLDAKTSKEQWSVSISTAPWDDNAVISAAPALHGNSLFFGSENTKVYAVDLKSTQQKWEFATGGSIHSSPSIAGEAVFVGSDDGNLYALDESTGQELWRWKSGSSIVSSPAISGEVVYVGSDDGNIYALQSPGMAARPPAVSKAQPAPTAVNEAQPGGLDPTATPVPRGTDVAMFRGDPFHTGYYETKGIPQKPELLWYYVTVGGIDGTPTYADGMLYFASEGGYFYAVDAETGIEKWQFKTETEDEMHSAPVVANGTVYFGSLDGNFYALDSATGNERWRFNARSRVWSTPTWVAGVVYFGADNGVVYGLDGETGEEVWRFALPSGVDNSVWGAPAVDEATNTVYIPGRDNFLYAVDRTTAREKWRYDSGFMIISTPTVEDGVVLFSNWYSASYAVDAATGKLLWQMDYGSKDGSIAAHDGIAYFGEESEPYLYAVEAKTGKILWQADLGHSANTSPIIAGGFVYITDFYGGVYAVDLTTGKLAWEIEVDTGLTAPVIWDGTLYIGSMFDRVLAYR